MSGFLSASFHTFGLTLFAGFSDEASRSRIALYTIPWAPDAEHVRPHHESTQALASLVHQTMLMERIPSYLHFDRWAGIETRVLGHSRQGPGEGLVTVASGSLADALSLAQDVPANGFRMIAFGTFETAGGGTSDPGTPPLLVAPTPAGLPLLLGALGVLGGLALMRQTGKAA